jgi:hypothetical protein
MPFFLDMGHLPLEDLKGLLVFNQSLLDLFLLDHMNRFRYGKVKGEIPINV